MMITEVSGWCSFTKSSTSTPSTSGMMMSVITTSKLSSPRACCAMPPWEAQRTS